MKYLKKYNESFFDFFKKDTEYDKVIQGFIHRLEKVKTQNPYHIELNKVPGWLISDKSEYYSKVYVIKFDDVDVVVSSDGNDLVYVDTGLDAGFEKSANPWKVFIGSDFSGLCERIYAKESYRKKLFILVDKVYNLDRLKNLKKEINNSADLID